MIDINTVIKTNALFNCAIRFKKDKNGKYAPLKQDFVSLLEHKTIESDEIINKYEMLDIINNSKYYNNDEKTLIKDWIFNRALKSLNNESINISYVYDNLSDILLTLDNNDFAVANIHPFSVNRMYYNNKRTDAYNKWWDSFPIQILDKFKDVDFNKPICAIYYYDHLERFDTHNFNKALTDRIASYFAIDDHCIRSMYCKTNKLVNKYEDGKIYIYICNIKAEE